MKILKYILASFFLVGVATAESEPIELLHAATMQKVTQESSEAIDASKGTYRMFDKDVHLKQGDIKKQGWNNETGSLRMCNSIGQPLP